jgi:pimeloyl-ACP methyl ester carboxylesterase
MRETIVFIHGMFMTPDCWHAWPARFEKSGYRVVAPPWPGRDKSVEALRKAHPDPAVGKLRLAEVVEHFDALVRAMPEPPVLIGHSMGGLIVQILLARGLGKKGIAIDPAPPKGVFVASWAFLKSNWAVVSPFTDADDPYLMSFEEFRYAWAHTLSEEAQRSAYDKFMVPESRRVGRDATTDVADIDFTRKTAPLLITAGASDHIVPAALNKKNHAAYAKCPSPTDFHEFPGRTHLVLSQTGWEEVADFVRAWMEKRA